jgi:hypothetical protein
MFLCEKKSYCGTLHGRDPFSYQLASGTVVLGIQWVPEKPTPVLPTIRNYFFAPLRLGVRHFEWRPVM